MGWLQDIASSVGAAPGAVWNIVARVTRDRRWPDQRRVAGGGRSVAGVVVTPDTAVKNAATWACLRYLSQTVAGLPWHVMRPVPRGVEVAKSHTVDWLLYKRPNREWGAFQFRETLLHWALRWGNGYAEIERDGLGRPIALWPIHPERVRPMRDLETNALYFEVDNGAGAKVDIDAMDMFHIRGFGEGPVGVNVIDYAAESLGWAIAAQTFGAAFFGNGMNMAGVVQAKAGMKEPAVRKLKAELNSLYRGPRNANKWAVLDAGMEAKALGVDPNKAQFIETQQHLVEEVCRWFGVPPHKVMHLLRATFTNIEHQSIEVVQDSILPWVKRFEEEADYKLFGQNRQGLFTKMKMQALLRGDFKSQQEGLEIMRHNGVINVDEWREYVDMNALPEGSGGDKYTMQSQYTTLDKIGETPDPAPNPNLGHNGGPPLDDPPDDLDEQARQLKAELNG